MISVSEFKRLATDESSVWPIGREFVSSHLPPLSAAESVVFMKDCFLTSPRDFSTALMLSAPELWSWMHVKDWHELIDAMCPRPQVGRWDLSEKLGRSDFYDIEFLLKWLAIDVLPIVEQLPDAADRRAIATYLGQNAGPLLHRSDPTLFWGGSAEIEEILTSCRSRLLHDGALPQLFQGNAERLLQAAATLLRA